MLQFSISLLFNQSLDTLLPAALRSLNLASKRLEAKGYLSVHEDLSLAILYLCFIGFVSSVFFFVLFIVSSARILPLFSSHFISSDLVTPCCFTTVLYWFVDNFSESKRSSVFFLWIRRCRTFACYFPFECCFAFEFDLTQHRPIHVAHPQLLLTLSHSVHVGFTWVVVDVYKNSQCFYRCGCLNCTQLSKYCWTLNHLSQCLHLTLALLRLTVLSNVDVMSYALPSFNSTDFR